MQGTQYLQRVAEQLKASEKARHSASKYDFVKVKVWVGENLAHYYVLSRFLISRMLTVTKVPQMKAVKIALEVKKHLVDNDFLDISQEHLEAILFNVMRARGFGDEYVSRYKMVSQFFQQRRSLIVLICGVPCTGKSTLAQQLASRLNMPNVLQTDAIYELMRMAEDGPLQRAPLWERGDLCPGELVLEYLRECRVVRKGLDGNLLKCIADGKSIIMEGMHLDPGLYLYEFGRYGQAHLRPEPSPAAAAQLPQQHTPAALNGAAASTAGTAGAEGPGMTESGAEQAMRSLQLEIDDGMEGADETSPPAGAAAADGRGQPLPAACLGGRRGGPAPQRRSASFMLSPSAGAGRMSPVLAHASELAAASAATAGVADACSNGSGGAPPMQPGQHSVRASPQSAGGTAASFLSLSPTTQWLQVASRSACSNGGGPPAEQAQQHHDTEMRGSSSLSGRQEDGERMPAPRSGTVPANLHAQPLRHASAATDARDSAANTSPGAAAQENGQGRPSAAGRSAGSHLGGSLAASAHKASPNGHRRSPATAAGSTQPHGGREVLQDAPEWTGGSMQERLKPGPVFVPIVLCMDDDDHQLLVEEWHAREKGPSDRPGAGAEGTPRTLERLRALQAHLCGYGARSVPVVKLELAAFNEALDRLHDYLLLCIQMAMAVDAS